MTYYWNNNFVRACVCVCARARARQKCQKWEFKQIILFKIVQKLDHFNCLHETHKNYGTILFVIIVIFVSHNLPIKKCDMF